jgi:hypothetical protein
MPVEGTMYLVHQHQGLLLEVGVMFGLHRLQPTLTVQLKKFVHQEAVDDADMLDADVTLRKEDYGEPGTSDYRKNMLMATMSLSEKFGVAKHK